MSVDLHRLEVLTEWDAAWAAGIRECDEVAIFISATTGLPLDLVTACMNAIGRDGERECD